MIRNNTSKKKQNSIAGFCKRVLVSSFDGAVYAMSQMTVTVFAAGGDTSVVTKPLDNLKTLVIAVIGAVGVIILAKNVMEFAQAYQQQDSSTMNSALKGIVAGAMMAGISSVLNYLRCPDRRNGKKIMNHLRKQKETEKDAIGDVLDAMSCL